MIVITGASDGLGLELAKLYKEEGKTVVNIARRECKYAEHNIVLNLREGAEIQEAARQILEIDEPIEALVNSIGTFSQEAFGDITEDEIKRLMSTNVKAPMLLTSELIERIKQDEADVLNVISTAGTKGNPAHPVYAASKWAERGYTKALQEELKSTKCRVISFCPGGMQTGFFKKTGENPTDESWMQPEDVATFVKNILDLPKNMEVSEVTVNRK
jgi:short-subunit dehydrogenase